MAIMRGASAQPPDLQRGLLDDTDARSVANSPPVRRLGTRAAARERVTVDLRGLSARLHAHACGVKKTPAAVVRFAIRQLLDGAAVVEPSAADETWTMGGRDAIDKVTLRMPRSHVKRLASRARSAEVSQGSYVAALLDDRCPTSDHAEAVLALRASTDRLAAMSVDLHAFMRQLSLGNSPELERYRAGIMAVASDLRSHLACSARLVAELRTSRRTRS